MTRHIAWQAILALLGIALIFLILFQLASNPTSVITEQVAVSGGTYTEGVLGYSESINPILAPVLVEANPVDQDLSALVFDGLTTLDATGQVSPSLALEWQASQDGTVYEFRLRRGVTWSDGAPFTAADVAFTAQAMQDPNYQGDPALHEIWKSVTVEQLDEYTIRFTLQEPFPSFLLYTTIGILPAHLLGDVPAVELPYNSFSTQNPVGTGRFLVESRSSDQVVLAANPRYWGPKPYLEKLGFWFYGDWNGLLKDYEEGNIQGFRVPKPQDLPTVAQLQGLNLYSAESSGFTIVFLNLRRDTLPFFRAKEVRQALLYGLDRQSLIDQTLGGQGIIADSPILPFSWAFDPSVRRYRFDPERAIGLLDSSGWLDSDANRIRDKDGVQISFTLATSDDPTILQMAQNLVSQWQALGIEVKLQSTGAEDLAQSIRERAFDAALIEIELPADPDPYPLWHSTQAESGQNFAGFEDQNSDLIMEQARLSADPKERLELFHSFQQIFSEEVPSLLLYYPIYSYAASAQVGGVQIGPLIHSSDRFREIENWYVVTEERPVTTTGNLDKYER